ncbi:MAG: hypothetical protein AMXMBFR33_55800 [Candidatus Xenobia bacterium]|jgi:hypothetical protein
MLILLFLLLLVVPVAAESQVMLAVDGVVCGSQFLDPEVNHPAGGEFNRSPRSNGGASYDDLKTETHVEVSPEEKITRVRGAELSVGGKLLVRRGETLALYEKRLGKLLPGQKSPFQTRFGRVKVDFKLEKGKVVDIDLRFVPGQSR